MKTNWRVPRGGRRRGIVLMLVTLHSVLILSAWAIANRQTVGLVRLRQALASREEKNQDTAASRLALAYGLALLETGLPSESPTTCDIDINVNSDAAGPEDLRVWRLTFTAAQPHDPEIGEYAETWTVAAAELGEGSPEDPPPLTHFTVHPPPSSP